MKNIKSIKNILGSLSRERTLICLFLGGCLLVHTGLRFQSFHSLSDDELNCMKMNWKRKADMVFAGDSRVMVDVSPAKMKQILKGKRILNYAFFSNGLSGPYLKELPNLLDPKSSSKTILLGITPHSLTPIAAELNGFSDMKRRFSEIPPSLWRIRVAKFFERKKNREFLSAFFMKSSISEVHSELHPDGWQSVTARLHPEESIEPYRNIFLSNQVDPQLVHELIATVRQWRSEGIRVYAFRPPTTKEMILLENELSGFDELEFQVRFTDAGGTWLEVDQTAYCSYDGSHLHRDAALAFSSDLAQTLLHVQNHTLQARLVSTIPFSREHFDW